MATQNVTFTNPSVISKIQTQISQILAALPTSAVECPSVTFLLNGKKVTVHDPNPSQTLLEYLRAYSPYSGTKQGCYQGGCGICTVMISYKSFDIVGTYVNLNVNSCLLRLIQCDGIAVTTNEGLGTIDHPHPIQTAFSKVGGFQCGYCTSGHIMSIYSTFQTQASQSTYGMTPSFAKSQLNLGGNLCRCTSSRPIIEAYKTLMVTTASPNNSPYVDQTSAEQKDEYEQLWFRWHAPSGDNVAARTVPIYNPNTDYLNAASLATPTFPLARPSETKSFTLNGLTQVNLASMNDLQAALVAAGDVSKVKIVNGHTSLGIPGYSFAPSYSTLINMENVPSMYAVTQTPTSITFGAGVKIANLWQLLTNSPNADFNRMAEHIIKISGYQVRNLGSWVGGVMMAYYGVNGGSLLGQPQYFYSDMALVLMGAGATVDFTVFSNSVTSNSSGTTINSTDYNGVLLEDFMRSSYNGLILMRACSINWTCVNATKTFRSFRSAARIYNAHAQAHMAIRITQVGTMAGPSSRISSAYVLVGAVGDGLVGQFSSYARFTALENYLIGKTPSTCSLNAMLPLVDAFISSSVTEPFDTPYYTEASQRTYKRELVKGFITEWLAQSTNNVSNTLTLDPSTSYGGYYYVNPTGAQEFAPAINLYPDWPNTGKYQPLPLAKATGQCKFNSDQAARGAGYIAVIYGGNADAPWFYATFPLDQSVPSYTYNWGTGADGVPVQKVDYASLQTQAAIATARETSGVKLVITYDDLQPNREEQLNFREAGDAIFGLFAQFYSFFNGLSELYCGQMRGTQQALDYLRNSNLLSDYLLYVGQPIGFVVAETPALAFATASKLSSNLAYVIPDGTNLIPCDPIVYLDFADLSKNKLYNRVSLDWGGNTYFHNTWGGFVIPGFEYSAVQPQVLDVFLADGITDVVNVFSTGYATSEFSLPTGTIKIGNPDHFCMNRVSVSTQLDHNGRKTLITDSQMPGTILQYMKNKFTYGSYLDATGAVYYYGADGPARWSTDAAQKVGYPNVDGTLVWDNDQWDVRTGTIGGNFGQKFGFFAIQGAAMLATNILNVPVQGESNWTLDFGDNSGNTQTVVEYQIGFNSSGRVTALSNNHWCDFGASWQDCNYGSVILAGSVDAVNQTYNWGAFQQKLSMVFTNKPAAQALRSVHWYDGNLICGHYIDVVSNALKAIHGSTGPSHFQTSLTNLIAPNAPFVKSASGIGAGLPCDNLGICQVSPLSLLDNSETWQSGVYADFYTDPSGFNRMYSVVELLQAIDRRVNEVYFTTGAISFFYPESYGYTGSPLPAPVSVGPAYDDVAARYPAIAALQAEVDNYNTFPENRFNKLGLAVHSGNYMTTSGYSLNLAVRLTINQDGVVKVHHPCCDSGQGMYDKIIDTVANSLYCPREKIVLEYDKDIMNTAGWASAGSVIASTQVMKAVKLAADSMYGKWLDYIYTDCYTGPTNYLDNNYLYFNMTNVFAPTGTYNVPAFTGAPATGAVYQTIFSPTTIDDASVTVPGVAPGTDGGQFICLVLNTGTDYETGWDGRLFEYVGTGNGNTGPVAHPDEFIAYGLAHQSNAEFVRVDYMYGGIVLPVGPYNNPGFAPSGSYSIFSAPSAEDLEWCKSNPDLARLTLIRYAQQKTANNPVVDGGSKYRGSAYPYSEWVALSEEEKQEEFAKWWSKITNGINAGAPSVDLPFDLPPSWANNPGDTSLGGLANAYNGDQRVQVEGTSWFFVSNLRTLMAEGQAYDSLISPWQWQGITIFRPFYFMRIFTAALSLMQLNVIDGSWREIHAMPVIDLGQAVNPLSDGSQLEGGYLMGRGMAMLEDKIWDSASGKNINYATWEYKPNCSGNAPVRMDSIILNSDFTMPPAEAFPNRFLAVGEVGLCASAAAPSALRQAIQAYRSQAIFGPGGNVPLDTTINDVQEWIDQIGIPMTNGRIKNVAPLPQNFTL